MPIKLLPQLRLLNNPSLPLSLSLTQTLNRTRLPFMKFGSSAPPALSRVFPLKLKYQALGFHNRRFSTRPFRPNSNYSRNGERRSEIRASKSLIDDEAELSDWVSELRTSSHRGKLTSDEEAEDLGVDKRRHSDRDKGRGREGGLGFKRRRESEFDSFSRNWRGGGSSLAAKRRYDESEVEDDESYSRRRNRGGRASFGAKRGGGALGFNDRGGRSDKRRASLISDDEEGFKLATKRRYNKSELEDDEDGGFYSRRGNRGGLKGGRGSFGAKRGGRELGFKNGRGTSEKRRASLISDDDEEEEQEEEEGSMGSFKEFLSEGESEESGGEDEEEDGGGVFKTSVGSGGGLAMEHHAKVVSRSSPGSTESYLSETRFDQCSISPLSLKGIKDAGYEKMTVVQEATLPVILKGKDVLAKAKTGTGKTVAFLLPAIEVVVKSSPVSRDQKRPPILVLVICPTRELASQAAAEANTLLKYHPSIGVQVVIGGTRLTLEQKRMQANPCQILVATPGRLRDHIENTAGFATRLMGVKVLVLDEADHLLDMGFRKDIEKIIAAVPKQRQTLLFSATVPEEVRQICHMALKRDHEFINTVQEGSEETHSQVRQMHLIAPLDKHFSTLFVLLKEHISDNVDYKVLVFCTTAMVTRLVADLLGELKLNVREIHSRKPQSYRTRISDEFRKSKGLILVTSDVSARGVDYPDVTLVIQVGLPADREQYIHRLGRTGRKGKEGLGILLLAPWEEFFLSSIKDLPITKAPVPLVDLDTRKKVERALSHVEMKNKEAAYQAWLGYYNSVKNVGRDKYRLVELANEFSRSMGLDNPPAIPKLVLGKMGLRNIPGLRSK